MKQARALLSRLRYLIACGMGVVVTAALFLLMVMLIQRAPLPADTAVQAAVVEIYTPPATVVPLTPPPPKTAAPVSATAQPALPPGLPRLHIAAPTAPTAIKLAGPPVAALAFQPQNIALPTGMATALGVGDGVAQGDRFVMSGSHGNGAEALAKKLAAAEAKGAEGYKEIVPFATRQPDIPRAAWESKTDGWVLVAFTVDGQGKVGNIQVLDAHPKGLFESSVVTALQGWQYDPADIGGSRTRVQLTQKIELHWRDYPNNSQAAQ